MLKPVHVISLFGETQILGVFYWRLVSERDVREAARQPEVESCEGEQPFREAADEASFLILF